MALRFCLLLTVVAVAATGTAHAQESAEGEPACSPDETIRARAAMTAWCGAAPAAPEFPGYDLGEVGLRRLRQLTAERDAYLSELRGFTRCLETDVIAASVASPYARARAVCARRWAEEQESEALEGWGMTCLAYEDRTGRSYDEACFP